MRRSAILSLLALFALSAWGAPARADVTLYDVRTGVYPEQTVVDVDNVVVTAVGMFVYFVQEPAPGPYGDYKYGAIQVYTAGNHTVHKGDVVNLRGTYMEFRGMSEIDVTISGSYQNKVGTMTVPAPVLCAMNEVNEGAYSEAYEGVLIRVDRDDNTLWSFAPDTHDTWALKKENVGTPDSLLMCHWSPKAGDDFLYTTPAPGTLITYAQGILIQRDDWTPPVHKLAPRDCENDLGTGCPPVLLAAYSTGNASLNVQFSVNVSEGSANNPANYQLVSGTPVLAAQRDAVLKKVVHLTTGPQTPVMPEEIVVNNVASENGGVVMSPNQVYDFRAGITPVDSIQYVPDPAVSGDSRLNGAIVTTTGRISGSEGNYYYIQSGGGGRWQGVYSRVAASQPFAIGDSVQVSGQVWEYNSETELRYSTGVDNVRKLGVAPHAVVVSSVTAPEIPFRGAAHTAEPWEGCLVKLANATFKDSLAGVPGPYYDEWLMRQQTNPVYPDTASSALSLINSIAGEQVDACVGDRVDITGILRYTYGWYRIAPRTGRGGDVLFLFDNPSCAPVDAADGFPARPWILDPNQPNPFAGSTGIRFTLPQAGEVTLEVLDVGGRLVRRLTSAPLAAGTHTYTWDGRNDEGRAVGSGTYFCRLRGSGIELSRKMVLVP